MTSSPPSAITLRLPSKHTSSSPPSQESFPLPTLDFLSRTWSVTHSSLPMWRSARNVRITYAPMPGSGPDSGSGSGSGSSHERVSDLVEYESKNPNFFTSGVNRVKGVDTASSPGDAGAWDWRGSGLLFFVTSHWEILGWGERDLNDGTGAKERWVVTWFQKTVFSAEGVDVYSDRKEGPSEGLKAEILGELAKLKELGSLVGEDLREVEIKLPWME